MTIIVVILGISLLILIHEFGHFLVAKKMGLLVEEFGFGFPPRIFSKKIGETTYSLNLLPFGGFVKIYGEDQISDKGQATSDMRARSFSNQPVWKRAIIIIAGVFMNFLLGWLLFSVIFAIGTPKAVLVSEVLPESPAALSGLKANDQIVSFSAQGGSAYGGQTAQEFISFINQNRGKEINLNLKREGKDLAVKAVPRLTGDAALGVAVVEAGIEKQPLLGSLVEGFKTSVTVVVSIFAAFVNLIWGLLTQGKILIDFVGPVGIFGVANQAGALGFLYLVQLIAMISLNLTVLNVLPFPALDGGRLLFVLIEKIKGSPLSPNFERTANTAGFIFLLLLMVAVTARDIARLF